MTRTALLLHKNPQICILLYHLKYVVKYWGRGGGPDLIGHGSNYDHVISWHCLDSAYKKSRLGFRYRQCCLQPHLVHILSLPRSSIRIILHLFRSAPWAIVALQSMRTRISSNHPRMAVIQPCWPTMGITCTWCRLRSCCLSTDPHDDSVPKASLRRF